jgi:hypothetical protein
MINPAVLEDAPHTECSIVNNFGMSTVRSLMPQFSGRALPCEARRERIMKWRARAVAATPCHGPLQLPVMRLLGCRQRCDL